MSDSASPGWYPNPSGEPNSVRYWDGQTWTETRQLDAPAAHVAPTAAPASAAPRKRRRKGMWIAAGALVIVAVIVGFTMYGDSTEDEAIDRCTSAVADRMKSPSTAEFSDVSAHETDSLKTIDEDYAQLDRYSSYGKLSRWVVTGDVDASNSFGATVRSEFNCSAIVGDGTIVGVEISYIE